MNQELIHNLNELAKHYKQAGDRWRGAAYQKAIVSIKQFPEEITKSSQLIGLPGVGAKIRKKIEDYLETGKIRQVAETKEKRRILETTNTEEGAIARLKGVWGVGPAKARDLHAQGIHTIEDLKRNPHLLNRQQQIGLKHYQDLLLRINREYILIMNVIILYFLNQEFGEGTYRFEIAGSYRRGEQDSGDIDCLLYSKHFGLKDAVAVLQKQKVITDLLVLTDQKFEGVACCPSGTGPHIRLDIEFVQNKNEWGSEMIYFTGNKAVNIMLRGEAKRRGWCLSQHGLFNQHGERIPAYTEEEIFQALGQKYIEPRNR